MKNIITINKAINDILEKYPDAEIVLRVHRDRAQFRVKLDSTAKLTFELNAPSSEQLGRCVEMVHTDVMARNEANKR